MSEELELIFTKPGLLTTIQGSQRIGYQSSGLSSGGPMDKKSAELANLLLGNHPETALLEITLQGPEILSTADCYMSLTGADLSAQIDGEPFEMNCPVLVEAGSIITFGKSIRGARAYLAIAGEWKIKPRFDTVSATSLNNGAFTPDSIIRKGSTLFVQPNLDLSNNSPNHKIPTIRNVVDLTMLNGPERNWLSDKQYSEIFGKRLRVTTDLSRMGFKLDFKIQDYAQDKELISSGIIPGTIQLSHEGQPIILLGDCQTIGGYPRIGILPHGELDKAGQLKPGDFVIFKRG